MAGLAVGSFAGATDPPDATPTTSRPAIVIDVASTDAPVTPSWELVTRPPGMLADLALRASDTYGDTATVESLSYPVAFPEAGRYYVWVHAHPPSRDRDSVHVGLDADWEARVPIEFATPGRWNWSGSTVHDQRAVIDVPSPGTHELSIWPRDAGVVLDRIVLSRDSLYLPPLAPEAILWSTDHERGDLDDWDSVTDGFSCGGAYHSDGGDARITERVAHSGRFAVELRIQDVEGDQGARLFRGRCASRTTDGLYYAAWLYFPEAYEPSDGWWNVWQWKSEAPDAEESDVMWVLDVWGDGESMHFRLRDKIDGDATWYDQDSVVDIPIGRWVHVEAFYLSAAGEAGRVVVWQDGTEIFRIHDVRTIHAGGDTRWSINNYTSSIQPDPAVLYADDAAIGTQRIGPHRGPFDGTRR